MTQFKLVQRLGDREEEVKGEGSEQVREDLSRKGVGGSFTDFQSQRTEPNMSQDL